MKKVMYYFGILAIGLCSCSTLKKQNRQVSEERQLQVRASADSMRWNGHLGNWSFDVKAGRYRLQLDSSAAQRQRSNSSLSDGGRSFFSYFMELSVAAIVLLGLFWGILRWLKQSQR